jgi:pullulanase/glycogen debranching enzyme
LRSRKIASWIFAQLQPGRTSRKLFYGLNRASRAKELGVTAVELLPVHQFIHYAHLMEKGLRNYWGYSSIGRFARHNEYASAGDLGQQVIGFQQMVKALHQAGIEVILDVADNHSSEGNHRGPMLAFNGIDNAAYHHLVADDPRHYMDCLTFSVHHEGPPFRLPASEWGRRWVKGLDTEAAFVGDGKQSLEPGA